MPLTSLPQMVCVGLCDESIVRHERPLPEEIDTFRSLIDYHRLHYIQEHGPSDIHVAWLARAADAMKGLVQSKFGKEIEETRRLWNLDKIDRPDIVPMIEVTGGSYSKRDESIGPGEPE